LQGAQDFWVSTVEKEAAKRKFCIEYFQVTGCADRESQARPVLVFEIVSGVTLCRLASGAVHFRARNCWRQCGTMFRLRNAVLSIEIIDEKPRPAVSPFILP
jgi:hypothetical protein